LDSEGANRAYNVICRFSSMDREYIALAPQVEENVVELFRYVEDEDGNVSVEDIASDMEFETITEAFHKISEQELGELLSESEEDTTVVITRDDGSECTCNIISLFEYDGKDYIALMPLEDIRELDGDGKTNLQIVLYGYSAYDDSGGHSNISLIPIPVGYYSNVEEHFMSMVEDIDIGVSA